MTDLVRLSRVVSHALRHEPWLYELELDDEGWASVANLLASLRDEPTGAWATLDRHDLEEMIESGAKRRHELRGDRIRALYGHSVPGQLSKEPAPPPATLFHGTSPTALPAILRHGLMAMSRQFVHLSVEVDTARQVGHRKSQHPVLLRVDAEAAHTAGIIFYRGNDQVWLASWIPPSHLEATDW